MSEPHSSSNGNSSASAPAENPDGSGMSRQSDQQRDPEHDRGSVARTIFVLIMLLLILLLIAAATGRAGIIRFANAQNANLGSQINSGLQTSSDIAAPGSLPIQQFEVGATFRAYYDEKGGLAMFGLPISPEMVQNGRTLQWFERARLERWPEYDGTSYGIQSGRVGTEFVHERNFPDQTFFVSQPGMRFFPETSHSARDRFLQIWEQNDGLRMFGLPISEQVQEQLSDGQLHTVQYFERARIEYHPEYAGTPNEMMLGLLGTGLYPTGDKPYSTNSRMGINVASNTPTPVPLP